MDPQNDDIVAPPAPIADCEEQLRKLGVEFKTRELPRRKGARGQIVCGAEQVVIYRRGPGNIRYNGSPLLTCSMAIGLAEFERIVQEEAKLRFGSGVARIEHGGTYSCRKMVRFANMLSEHSFANAIDIKSLTLRNGRKLSVLRHFGKLDSEPTKPEGIFLRGLARRLYDEQVFSVVLTPFWDKLHRDHFHFDMARYRVDGTR
jgi:hypothetical protein